MSAADVKATMNEATERANDKACADEVQAVLTKYNRGLQPFVQNIEPEPGIILGTTPRVRLVRIAEPQAANDTNNAESKEAAN